MQMLEALEGMTAAELLALPEDERQAFIDEALKVIEYHYYNKLEAFQPYSYQREFMKAGAVHNTRFLRAGNRLGKTYGGAYEMAYHITGRYPDWWQGKRINSSGHKFWCIGVNLRMVKDIQQEKLLGTSNITMIEEVGTGTIPRECIILDRGLEKNGAQVESIRIKHTDGGFNTLEFYGSTNQDSLMGRKVACVWMDEEAPNSSEIFDQVSMRVTNALEIGEDGLIYITATPEQGETELNKKFFNKETENNLYGQQVTWWDVPELFSKSAIEEMLSKLSPWMRDMRSKGLPFAGHGAVFKYSDDDLVIDDVHPLPHWEVLAAIDWGNVVDPTVIAIVLRDPDTQTYYLYDLYYLKSSEFDRSPVNVAQILLKSPYANVPVIIPHDSGLESSASETKGKILVRCGVNVSFPVFRNPPASTLKAPKYGSTPKAYNDIATGLEEMNYLMQEGKLKVCRRCQDWLTEKHSYSYKYNPNTGRIDTTKPDHAMDASRYGFLSLVGNRGGLWGNALAPSFAGNVEPEEILF
ncbi:terminase family protein [Salmonella enterica]|nr:terminase family protein [Salmonella enterica]